MKKFMNTAETMVAESVEGFVRAASQQYLDTAQLFTALGGQRPERAPAMAASDP